MIGFSSQTNRQLIATAILIVVLVVSVSVISAVLKRVMRSFERAAFWAQQVVRLLGMVVLLVGLSAIWVQDVGRMATMAGLLTAGIAIALQRVITSFAGYLIILRGKSFTVGDRVTMGGVRGDVVALGFMQTTVLEMGEPPDEQADAPATWVRARQYTGRLVRITNDKIFDTPVYNYTRDFPFVWEEMHLPIKYTDDRAKAEEILLDVARRHTEPIMRQAAPGLARLRKLYAVDDGTDMEPKVYYRLTDNWLEMTLRFVAPVRGVRHLKDGMSRDIMKGLDAAKIGIASGTYEIVGVPPIKVQLVSDAAALT
jgi:small-conductance mechanosensitive channel